MRLRTFFATTLALCVAAGAATAAPILLPDGRSIEPAGFTVPVEGFASAAVLAPDGKWLAVLAQDGGAVDLISTSRSVLRERLAIPSATGIAWTSDGLYVTRGYTGTIARYAYDAAGSKDAPVLAKLIDLSAGPGLLNGVAEDPATHRLAVARSANREVLVFDSESGALLARHAASGQPFRVGFLGSAVIATLYDSDHVDAWTTDTGDARRIATGPHPTELLIDGTRAYVANADGHDVVAIDGASLTVAQRYELALAPSAPPGQTPAGMAIASDRTTLYVAESGFNDVAVVDLATGRVRARIPTAWYPAALAFVDRATVGKKDARAKPQLWIASAQGLGAQPDPGGEWDGTYTGLVQHIVVEPARFAAWTAQVARNDRFARGEPVRAGLPPIEHVVFVVRENKHFDEEFGDERAAESDPALLLYGRAMTPNMHALAEQYTLFDDLMSDGEASIYGHAWTTQAIANDYHERNAHSRDENSPGIDARVAWSIWPYPMAGEDTATPAQMDFDWFRDLADLPAGPRVNVSGVFGPRGELIDALQRKHVSFRVYGEQLTMQPDGRIVPGLADHAARDYPGEHIDFGVLDTDRARIFLDDVRTHGLAQYTYLTLPTDHTAGTSAGFLTPASYIGNNDLALGRIIAGLSQRADWKNTVVIVTCDDAQGTGDHVDSHRMPAFAVGPYIRRGFVSHTRYSQTSILRTVEMLFGVPPLSIYDAAATPMLDMFAREPQARTYAALPDPIPLVKNPGKAISLAFPLDGPGSRAIPDQEWRSVRGTASLALHRRYLAALGGAATAVADGDSVDR